MTYAGFWAEERTWDGIYEFQTLSATIFFAAGIQLQFAQSTDSVPTLLKVQGRTDVILLRYWERNLRRKCNAFLVLCLSKLNLLCFFKDEQAIECNLFSTQRTHTYVYEIKDKAFFTSGSNKHTYC